MRHSSGFLEIISQLLICLWLTNSVTSLLNPTAEFENNRNTKFSAYDYKYNNISLLQKF